mgnify:CR=1 FL=1
MLLMRVSGENFEMMCSNAKDVKFNKIKIDGVDYACTGEIRTLNNGYLVKMADGSTVDDTYDISRHFGFKSPTCIPMANGKTKAIDYEIGEANLRGHGVLNYTGYVNFPDGHIYYVNVEEENL